MGLDIGTGGPEPRKAVAAKKKKTTRAESAKSKSKPTRPRSEEHPNNSVRPSRPVRALERDNSTVSSDREASRELVGEQASVSRDLIGPRRQPSASEESTVPGVASEERPASSEEPSFFSRVTDSVSNVVDRITEGDESEESQEVEATEEPGGAEEERSLWDRVADGTRGLVENIGENLHEAREQREEREAEAQREAQEAYAAFSEDPQALAGQLSDGLGDFSDAERLAIAQLSQENEGVGDAASRAVSRDIESFESFSDIPNDRASQILLNAYSGEEGSERLGGLLEDHLNSELDAHIERLHERGDRGDTQADGAIEALLADAEDLASSHPALAAQLEDRFNSALQSSGDQITDVRRNDDNWAQRVGHTVSGGVRSIAGGLGDGLRFAVRGAGDVLDFPQSLGADIISAGTEFGGDVLGTGLDALGQEGAADFVRDTSQTVSDGVQTVSDIQSNINEDIFIGVGEGSAGLVEGLGEVVANPVGTVQSLGTIANAANPLTLPIDIIRNGGDVRAAVESRNETFLNLGRGVISAYQETNDEHGAVAATSHALFDIVTTVGTGGSVAGARATSIAGRLGNLGRAGRFADELGSLARFGDDAARFGDDAARLGDDAVRLGDDTVRLGDDTVRLGDDTVRTGDDATRPADSLNDAAEAAPPRPRRPRRELGEDELAVQQRANGILDSDLDGFVARYEEEFGRVLDLDDARELFDDFSSSPANRSRFGTAIHGPSSRLIEEVFDRRLAESVPPGARPQVVFTAGGSGSGKSSVRGLSGNAIDDADFVFDSTLANLERSRARINQVLDSGRDANISFVYRDPIDAFVNGVLPRAAETGRIVPVEAFAATHQKVRGTVARLADEFAGDSRFSLDVIDNSRGRGSAQFSTLDDLPVQSAEDLTGTLYNSLEEAFQNGDIPQHVYDAFIRERP